MGRVVDIYLLVPEATLPSPLIMKRYRIVITVLTLGSGLN